MINGTHSKATIDLLAAAKAVMERDLELGLVSQDDLITRFAPAYRKQQAQELSDAGFSNRKIAKLLGVSAETVNRDLRVLSVGDATSVAENATSVAGCGASAGAEPSDFAASDDALEDILEPEPESTQESESDVSGDEFDLEHYRSALVIQASQAIELAEMFLASIEKAPNAITGEAIRAVHRAAFAWQALAAKFPGEKA